MALNDIGAVSWLAPVKVIDLIGLASSEVADARRQDADGTVFFGDLLFADTAPPPRVCRFLLRRPPTHPPSGKKYEIEQYHTMRP